MQSDWVAGLMAGDIFCVKNSMVWSERFSIFTVNQFSEHLTGIWILCPTGWPNYNILISPASWVQQKKD